MKLKNKLFLLSLFFLVVGTYAWSSMSQIANNTVDVTSNPGVRLHDDYHKDSGNKDIYVENFGETAVLVRVKLYEYLEVGGASLISGAQKNDVTTWSPFLATSGAAFGTDTAKFRDYIGWDLGTTTTGKKVYLPTFNVDKDNLSSDASGDGKDVLTGGATATGDGTEDYFKLVTNYPSLDGTQNHLSSETLNLATNTYYASANATAISNTWLLDSDGWWYWLNVLPPNFSTGLLLTNLKYNLSKLQATGSDYQIEVVSEAATVNDYMKFFDGSSAYGDGTEEAKARLALIADTGILNSTMAQITAKPGDVIDIRAITDLGFYDSTGTARTSIASINGITNQTSASTTYAANKLTVGTDETADEIKLAITASVSSTNQKQGFLTVKIDKSSSP